MWIEKVEKEERNTIVHLIVISSVQDGNPNTGISGITRVSNRISAAGDLGFNH
jgi:hypothetical protein